MGINFAIGPLVGHLRQPELFKNTQKQACKKNFKLVPRCETI
jgi:hypothetical protein